MPTPTSKPSGGLVLQKSELINILNEPNTVGLAFALNRAGQASDVNLNVLRVYKEGNILKGEKKPVQYKKGAASPLNYPATLTTDYRFRFLKQLEDDKFYFGFYAKEKFNLLDKDGWDEIYIGGGKRTFPHTEHVDNKETWFSLSLYLRKKVKTEALDETKSTAGQLSHITSEGMPQITIPPTKGRVTMADLLKANTNILKDTYQVSSVITDKTQSRIKGIVFDDNGREVPVLFDNKQLISGVLLNLDKTLKALEKVGYKPSIKELAQEELSMGGFPLADHTDPCPPHWYPSDDPLNEAVTKAL